MFVFFSKKPTFFFITFVFETGRVHFGYLFGFGTLGASSINILLNLMSEINIDLTVTLSVLGYSVLPVVLLSAVKIIFSLK